MADHAHEMTLAGLRSLTLSLTDLNSRERALEVWDRVEFAKITIRAISALLNEALVDWINANGDLQVDETRRLYVGTTKKVTSNNQQALLEALLDATGGDVEALVKCMAASAFKHGACRTLLKEAWDTHFTSETVEDLKTGKPKKTVKLLDDKFTATSAAPALNT